MNKTTLFSLCFLTFFGISPVFAATPSDGEIAKVIDEANDAEIKAGKLAEKRAQNNEVKNFAKMMVDTHKQNEKEGEKIQKSAKIKSKSSDMTKNFKKDSNEQVNNLKKLKGDAFDKAYMSSEVMMHEKMLSNLENDYIPNAQNPELKAHLEKTKTHVQEHLNQAKQIQESLGVQVQ